MGLSIPSKPWAEKPAARVPWLSGHMKARPGGWSKPARPTGLTT